MSRARLLRVALMGGLLCGGALACGDEPDAKVPPTTPPVAPTATAVAFAPPAATTPDAPFREKAPAPSGPISFTPPSFTPAFKLKNGLSVYVVERHDLPVATARFVGVGAAELGGPPGAASFMGALIESGTKTKNALQISDEYEAMGAQHGAWLDWDASGAYVQVPAPELDKALTLLSEVLKEADFKPDEIKRFADRRKNGLKFEKSSPGAMLQNAVPSALYGRKHVYGSTLSGREEDLPKATRAELLRLYQGAFRAGSSALVIVGDTTKDKVQPLVEKLFAGLPTGTTKAKVYPAPKAHAEAARLVLIDKPNATQSQVGIVDFGIARSNPDRDAVSVMNSVLGGMFSSRINLNLREKNAYTYGAHSRFASRRGVGTFSAGGAIFSDKTAAAIGELLGEIRRMSEGGVTDDELEGAKRNVLAAMPAWFETTSDVSGAAASIFTYGLPADDYAASIKRIEGVTKDDVARVAKLYLVPSRMTVIVVGDQKKIGASLEALHLGTPAVYDEYGDPIAPAKAAAPVPAKKEDKK